MGRHLLIHLDDSETRRELVYEACQRAGMGRNDILQTGNPQEVLNWLKEMNGEILAVITDNQIHGVAWAEHIVAASTAAGIPHIMVYSSVIPASLAPTIARITKTENRPADADQIGNWVHADLLRAA